MKNRQLKKNNNLIIVNGNNSVENYNSPENDTNTSDIGMEQDPLKIDLHEQCGTELIELKYSRSVQRSISCQTDELPDDLFDRFSYCFCNLYCRDGISTAAVQVHLTIEKKDRQCV